MTTYFPALPSSSLSRTNEEVLRPGIDNRSYDDVLLLVKSLARSYLNNEWSFGSHLEKISASSIEQTFGNHDVGVALSKIFVSMHMNLINRLNKVPYRNFIEFLNTMGFGLSPPVPAHVPVTFLLADGAKEDVLVFSGARVAADANEEHDELLFETEKNLLVTHAKLVEVYSLAKNRDAIYGHIEAIKNKQEFTFFYDDVNGNLQNHVLYLGHEELFNFKDSSVKIILTLFTDDQDNVENLSSLLADSTNVSWEYNWKHDKDGKEIKDSAIKFNFSLDNENASKYDRLNSVVLDNRNNNDKEIVASEVEGMKRYWIRCRFLSNSYSNKLSKFDVAKIPSINGIVVEIQPVRNDENSNTEEKKKNPNTDGNGTASQGGDNANTENQAVNIIAPDMLFYNDTPIKKEEDDDGIERFYPFGKQPFTHDIFYIACNDAFSKKNSEISLNFIGLDGDLKGEASASDKPILSWQYWNGKAWNMLPIEHKNNEIITFVCPTDVEATSVNGNENYWIRIMIASGDYGKGKLETAEDGEGKLSLIPPAEVNFEYDSADSEIRLVSPTDVEFKWTGGIYEWNYDDINKPSFESLEITFSYADPVSEISKLFEKGAGDGAGPGGPVGTPDGYSDEQLKTIKSVSPFCITSNNLESITHTDENNIILGSFKSFRGFSDDDDVGIDGDDNASFPSPSCYIYLGFDKKLEKGPIQIHLSVIEKRKYDYVKGKLNFYYYSKSGWSRLIAEDSTKYLIKKGYFTFYVPDDFEIKSIFGKNLFWIRIGDTQQVYEDGTTGKIQTFPRLKYLSHNTVSCINAYSVADELLARYDVDGSSLTNKYDFTFSKKPLADIQTGRQEEIWVREKNGASPGLQVELSRKNRIRETRDATGNIIETWVLWKAASELLNSNEDSQQRIYSIDRIMGKLTLGSATTSFRLMGIDQDEYNSLIVRENISRLSNTVDTRELAVKSSYISAGDGREGNVEVGEVKTLKTRIPFIDSVVNYDAGEGGSDIQPPEDAVEIWPQLIKNRGKPVTADDFESLAKGRFLSLSKAKCFPNRDINGYFRPGHVLLIVIPKTSKNTETTLDSSATISNAISQKPAYPSIGQIEKIKQYLGQYADGILVIPNNFHVLGPIYYKLTISSRIYVDKIDDISEVMNQALNNIKQFLDPLTGGQDHTGWDLGQILLPSDVYAILSSISKVDHIGDVTVEIDLDTDARVMDYNTDRSDNSVTSDKVTNHHRYPSHLSISDRDPDFYKSTYRELPIHSMLYDGSQHNLIINVKN
jgi:hypothetical protein